MPVDLKELRRLHEAATTQGAWVQEQRLFNWTIRRDLPSLLDRLEAAEAENARLREEIVSLRINLRLSTLQMEKAIDAIREVKEAREALEGTMNLKDIALFENSEQVANERLLRYSGEIVMEQKQQIAALEAALAAERKRVAELEADRERLDLMEELHDAAPWPDTDEQPEGPVVRVWIVTRNGEHKPYGTLREAIDAAREAKG